MDTVERSLLFESALQDYHDGLADVASRQLDQLLEDGSRHPAHLSFCGLLRAQTAGRLSEGISLCEQAVARNGRRDSVLYSNLATVLAMRGFRRRAIAVLLDGLRAHPEHPALKRQFQRLVPRAKPLMPGLGRRHPVNKYYGLARTLGWRLVASVLPRYRPNV